jgi:hypothetical protein
MQREPDIADILSAVADQLMRDVLPALPRDAAYHARVSINAIRLVERELRRMPAAEIAERERLAALLGVDREVPVTEANAMLISRIEAGDFDQDPAALNAHLWATTLDQLAIDQPNYGQYRADVRA